MSSETDRRERFEAIAAEVYDPLQRYLRRRATAEESGDVFSDVLLTVWRRLDDVPPEAVLPWCYGVARRTLSNHRRSAQRHLRLVQRLESEREQAPGGDPADALRDQDPDLAEALAGLPAADREILRLWAWEQLEPREIGQVLGSTANAVSLRLSRARKKLAESLTRQDDSNPGHIAGEHAEEEQR
jgi:RNA polymerase sigma-70 factor (ECF subfamily)